MHQSALEEAQQQIRVQISVQIRRGWHNKIAMRQGIRYPTVAVITKQIILGKWRGKVQPQRRVAKHFAGFRTHQKIGLTIPVKIGNPRCCEPRNRLSHTNSAEAIAEFSPYRNRQSPLIHKASHLTVSHSHQKLFPAIAVQITQFGR